MPVVRTFPVVAEKTWQRPIGTAGWLREGAREVVTAEVSIKTDDALRIENLELERRVAVQTAVGHLVSGDHCDVTGCGNLRNNIRAVASQWSSIGA